MFKEVLKNVPSRGRMNVHYILDKMFQSKDAASWNESGEFISNGSVIRRSHELISLQCLKWEILEGDLRVGAKFL